MFEKGGTSFLKILVLCDCLNTYELGDLRRKSFKTLKEIGYSKNHRYFMFLTKGKWGSRLPERTIFKSIEEEIVFMNSQQYFERYELKYLITIDQYHRLLEVMKDKMKGDSYGKSTVCNIYYDTPNYLLVRRSIEKPVYKEKLRLRTYSLPDDDTPVFLELKKKYKKRVYKRRECMKYKTARDFLGSHEPFSQVTKEIAYFMDFYKDLYPAIFLSYDREAFMGISDSGFRITFDTNILGRNENVSFESGIYGYAILPDDAILMEIKTATSIPLWLTSFLTKERIFDISFSKYGNVYKLLESNKKIGGMYHV